MSSCLILYNPAAGNPRNRRRILSVIRTYLQEEPFRSWQFIILNKEKDTAEIIKEAMSHNISHIVVAGGDGTVRSVASCLLNKQVLLSILPTGSGNGIAREWGLTFSPEQFFSHFDSGQIISMDSGYCNEFFFLCTCGFGVEAMVAHRFHNMSVRGLPGYIAATMSVLLKMKNYDFYYAINGKKDRRYAAYIATVANIKQWGNNFYISPFSQPADGKMELVFLRKKNLYALLYDLYLCRKNKLQMSDDFFSISFTTLQLNVPSLLAHVDGEPVQIKNPVNIVIYPKSIRIWAVKNMH